MRLHENMSAHNAQVHSNDVFSTNEMPFLIFEPFFQKLADSTFKVSEIERKHTYVRQGCPKGTTKAINHAFLLVTPISHTHSNYLHMHAPEEVGHN